MIIENQVIKLRSLPCLHCLQSYDSFVILKIDYIFLEIIISDKNK